MSYGIVSLITSHHSFKVKKTLKSSYLLISLPINEETDPEMLSPGSHTVDQVVLRAELELASDIMPAVP